MSSSTPHGQLIAGAGALSGQQGWRRHVGRFIAYVALAGAGLAGIAVIAGIVWLFVQ